MGCCYADVGLSSGSGSAQTPAHVLGGSDGVMTRLSDRSARVVVTPARTPVSVLAGEQLGVRHVEHKGVAAIVLCVMSRCD